MQIENIPPSFLASTKLVYPTGNTMLFEKYFHREIAKRVSLLSSDVTYLPIYWTDYYINNGFGASIQELDSYLKTLDRSKKYFTIVQYDDGIINTSARDLDLYTITQGTTKNSNYVIPLNCVADPNIKTLEKNIYCSFFGRYTTHPIRGKMKEILENKSGYLLSAPVPYHVFSEILSRSLFCLCPRGYGETSFRICEALQRGTIPVYISDVFAMPFNDKIKFEKYGVSIHENDIQYIDDILKSLRKDQIEEKLMNIREIYQQYYDYQGCCESLIQHLENVF